MPPRNVEVSLYISIGREFQAVRAALKAIDKDLPKKLRRTLRDAAKPLATEAKAKVKALPRTGRQHTGLYARVARGVRIQSSLSRNPRVRVVTSMPDRSEAALPRGLDDPYGWRHPVFGDRETWVRQRGYSWFMETMQDGQPDVQRAIVEVLDEARDTIIRAGRV